MRHNTERAGCDAAHPHLQAARRTLLQPGAASGGSEQRQQTSHKLQLCPEKYLPIVEGVIDGAIKLKDADDEKEDV